MYAYICLEEELCIHMSRKRSVCLYICWEALRVEELRNKSSSCLQKMLLQTCLSFIKWLLERFAYYWQLFLVRRQILTSIALIMNTIIGIGHHHQFTSRSLAATCPHSMSNDFLWFVVRMSSLCRHSFWKILKGKRLQSILGDIVPR